MKKNLILLFAIVSSIAFANEEPKATDTNNNTNEVSAAEVSTVDPKVAERRAKIKERLEANKKNAMYLKNDAETQKRIAAMRLQREKIDAINIKLAKVEGDIVARKDAIIKTNESASSLSNEIAELEKQLSEKKSAIQKIIDEDAEYVKLEAEKEKIQKQLSEETKKSAELVHQNMKARTATVKEEAAPAEKQAE
jgi:regulator of replication initiation timing